MYQASAAWPAKTVIEKWQSIENEIRHGYRSGKIESGGNINEISAATVINNRRNASMT